MPETSSPSSVCLPMWSPPTSLTTRCRRPNSRASSPPFIRRRNVANGTKVPEKVVLEPPVSIKKSISASHLISMEDGRPYKSLKRHLTAGGLTPAQYREKWSLPFDYPMVAPNYSKARSEFRRPWVSVRTGRERKARRSALPKLLIRRRRERPGLPGPLSGFRRRGALASDDQLRHSCRGLCTGTPPGSRPNELPWSRSIGFTPEPAMMVARFWATERVFQSFTSV